MVYTGFFACGDTAEANVAMKETFNGIMQQETTEILHEVKLLLKLKHRNIVQVGPRTHIYAHTLTCAHMGKFLRLRTHTDAHNTHTHTHTNTYISQFYGLWTRDGIAVDDLRLYMVMELCSNGSLQEYIGYPGTTIAQKLSWACDVSDGLYYLHTRTPCVVHRDIKPGNVVISESGCAKLVDFGISRTVSASNGPLTNMVGTVAYMAPELMGDDAVADVSLATAVDIYSMGVLLGALWTGKHPYESSTTTQILALVTLHNKRPTLEMGKNEHEPDPNLHERVCISIRQMWDKDPNERPTALAASKIMHELKDIATSNQQDHVFQNFESKTNYLSKS